MNPDPLKLVRTRLGNYVPRTLDYDHSTCSAVIAILDFTLPADIGLFLIRRSLELTHHRGEIGFPGGRCEAGDNRKVDTALRELKEELSIEPEKVDVWGRLDDVKTNTGFIISPFVGSLREKADIIPDPEEVAEVLRLPPEDLFTFPHRIQLTRVVAGVTRTFPGYRLGEHLIWGATARIIDKFRMFMVQSD